VERRDGQRVLGASRLGHGPRRRGGDASTAPPPMEPACRALRNTPRSENMPGFSERPVAARGMVGAPGRATCAPANARARSGRAPPGDELPVEEANAAQQEIDQE